MKSVGVLGWKVEYSNMLVVGFGAAKTVDRHLQLKPTTIKQGRVRK
ncbi:MAG: hypothetical protein GY714_19960 [Desulfobacterales bacterium]|nr:hypothetical protein [Desulfobacterales bacterium]